MRREILEPLDGVNEVRNFFLSDAKLHQDLVLGWWGKIFLLCVCWRGRRACRASLDFSLQSSCSCGDWHSSAVESEGPQDVLAKLSLETSCEFVLGQGESMSQVQEPVHIRVRESHEVLLFILLFDRA